MSLEDELKLKNANQKISDLMAELKEANEKISELKTELNNAKNKEIMLGGEVRSLKGEIKYIQAKGKNVDILNDRIQFLEKERDNLEESVKNLEEKIELKEKRIDELSQEKENLFGEKSQLLEGKSEIFQQISDKDLELQQKDQKLTELREKFKKSSSDLLNKSMEIEKLVKKVKSLEELGNELKQKEVMGDKEEKELREKIESLEKEVEISHQKITELEKQKRAIETGGEVGTLVIFKVEDVVDYIKKMLPQVKSTIRLVLPDLHDLEKFEITNIIKKMPSNVILNIAANIDDPLNDTFVKEIKNYCQLTNYNEKKFLALNVDSSKFIIGVFKGNEIIGIYTDTSEFIVLFKQAIMEPFIKGKKLF